MVLTYSHACLLASFTFGIYSHYSHRAPKVQTAGTANERWCVTLNGFFPPLLRHDTKTIYFMRFYGGIERTMFIYGLACVTLINP